MSQSNINVGATERLRAIASDLLAKAEDLKEHQVCSAPRNKDVVMTAATDTKR
jgi:hypothetical protein